MYQHEIMWKFCLMINTYIAMIGFRFGFIMVEVILIWFLVISLVLGLVSGVWLIKLEFNWMLRLSGDWNFS